MRMGRTGYCTNFAKVSEKDEDKREARRFMLTDEWGQWGIKLWDGTSKDIRTEYPRDLQQHRLVQFDSCRGLEGWVVACLWLDEFVAYKQRDFDKKHKPPTDELFDPETRESFAYRWSMIPMTRAVDTLVITLRNSRGRYAEILRKVAMKCKDFVEWID